MNHGYVPAVTNSPPTILDCASLLKTFDLALVREVIAENDRNRDVNLMNMMMLKMLLTTNT